jgi:hypothetical protein
MQEQINRTDWKPVHIQATDIAKLKAQHAELQIVDQYNAQLEEIFLLRNPKYKFDKNYQADFELFIKEQRNQNNPDTDGSWFYFPWSNQLVHYVPEELHFEMRTGRNKLLITAAEQEAYYQGVVGIAGLSVGSHAALTIAMTGGAKTLKLADPDTISGPNLNRIRTGAPNIGTNKAMVVARSIYEINPYANIILYTEGFSESMMSEFFEAPKLNVFIEEMDNPYFKFKSREEARKRGIATIMATDNGDGVIADVERYDISNSYPIFHGLAGKLSAEGLKNMPPKDLPKVAGKIAGANLVVPRMLESVAEVGNSLYSWPQLGTAANMCGTILAYLTREIILKNPKIKSGRRQMSTEATFISGYNSITQKLSRKKTLLKFIWKMMHQK